LRQELFGEGFFGMVMEEGESGHGEDCVAQRFSYGDLTVYSSHSIVEKSSDLRWGGMSYVVID
jgi:archaellum biogenesis ATPase FlaH